MKKILIFGLITMLFGILFGCTSDIEDGGLQTESISGDLPATGLQQGMIAPDFDLVYLNDDSGNNGKKLSGLRGKPVLLNFWATWCPPCVAEMPYIEKAYANTDISIIAVNIGENRDTVTNFIHENGYTFPIAIDESMSIGELYNIQSIPQTFVLDSKGVITDYLPYSMSEEMLDEIIERVVASDNNP